MCLNCKFLLNYVNLPLSCWDCYDNNKTSKDERGVPYWNRNLKLWEREYGSFARLPVFLKTDLASLQEYSRPASIAMNTDRLFRRQKRSCGMRNTSMFRWTTYLAEQTALTVFGIRTNEIINPLMRKHRKSLTCVLAKTLPSAKSWKKHLWEYWEMPCGRKMNMSDQKRNEGMKK